MAEGKSEVAALGLDIGKKRIGVAGCDRTGLIAAGITTLERTSFSCLVKDLQAIIADRRIEILVVGLPYCMDGSIGFQARQVQSLAKRLEKALQKPIEFVDERLTSFEAEQQILAANRSPSQDKAAIDRKAAAIILQQWLDNRRRQSTSKLTTEGMPDSAGRPEPQ